MNENKKLTDLTKLFTLYNTSREKQKTLKDSIVSEAEEFTNKTNVANNIPLNDAYGNKFTAVGTEDKIQSFSNYGFSNDTLNWPLWLALYNDSWIFRKIIDKYGTDIVRSGFTLTNDELDTDKKNLIYIQVKKLRKPLIELLKWGALFGGSIAVVMFDNFKDEDYNKPLNVKKIREAKHIHLYVTDRWYGVSPSTETVENMNSLDYGKPKSYTITLPNGHLTIVHHDYILRYEHRTAPQLVKEGYLQGWGYSEGSHILNELARDDQLKADITSLVNKALIEVIKMDGMKGIFMGQDEQSQEQLQSRLEMVQWARNFNSLTFLDSNDEYQEHGFSGLSGLADLLQQNMWVVAAAVDMQGILFGDLKGGLSTDEDALERYDEVVQNKCEDFYRSVLTKLLFILFKRYDINLPIDFEFNSLLIKKHDDEKMESLVKFKDFLSNLLQDGVIDTQKYAQAIQNYINLGQIDLGFDDEYINSLKDKFEEEMENIDLEETVDEPTTSFDTSTLKIKDTKRKRWSLFKRR